MANIGRPPCDEGVIRTSRALAPCTRAAAPWVLAATIVGSAMAFIDGTGVNVALPQMQQRLEATAVGAQWIVEAYALFLAALILVGGSLGDHFGRRRIFLVGVGIFTVASVACARPDPGTTHRSAGGSGHRRSIAGPGLTCDHRCVFQRGESRQGHRDMVGFLWDHDGHRPCCGRISGGQRLLAGGVLAQRAARNRGHPHRPPLRPREPGSGC